MFFFFILTQRRGVLYWRLLDFYKSRSIWWKWLNCFVLSTLSFYFLKENNWEVRVFKTRFFLDTLSSNPFIFQKFFHSWFWSVFAVPSVDVTAKVIIYRSVKFRKNLWGHGFSQNANQKLPGFLPYPLINFQGRNPGKFWLTLVLKN